MKLKKIMAVMLAVTLVIAFSACGKDDSDKDKVENTPYATQMPITFTQSDALEKCLNEAGVTADKVTGISIEPEHEGFNIFYRVSFMVGDNQYQYRLDVQTGEFVSAE